MRKCVRPAMSSPTGHQARLIITVRTSCPQTHRFLSSFNFSGTGPEPRLLAPTRLPRSPRSPCSADSLGATSHVQLSRVSSRRSGGHG